MSNFLNKYVAIKKYNSSSCKIKEIWNHSGHENCCQKRDVGTEQLKLSFSSENEAKNPAIPVQYKG